MAGNSNGSLQQQQGSAVPKAVAMKPGKGGHGRQVLKVNTPGGRGEAQKQSPAQAKFGSKFSGSSPASQQEQMAEAMKILTQTVSQAMMGGVPAAGQTQQGVRERPSYAFLLVNGHDRYCICQISATDNPPIIGRYICKIPVYLPFG